MNVKLGEKSLKLIAIGLCASIFCFLYYRLFFGVDLTDEALYNALPLAFARGRRPYIDELMVVQSASLLLQPLVHFFLSLQKTGEGLVLFMRHCFFALSILATYSCFCYQRKYLPLIPALLGSFLVLSFWPFSIPSLSYNTMGMLFLLMGTVLVLEQADRKQPNSALPTGIALLLLAGFCYPTFAIPALILCGLAVVKLRKSEISKGVLLASLSVCILFGLALGYLVFFYTSPERLAVILNFVRSYGIHGTWGAKLLLISKQLIHDWKFISFQAAFLLIPPLMFKYSQRWTLLLSLIFAVFLLQYSTAGIDLPPYHITIISLSLVAFMLAFFRREFIIPVSVAILAGGMSSWTSGNGLFNFAIGAMIGAVAYAILLYRSLDEGKDKSLYSKLVYFVMIGSVVSFQLRSLTRSVYGDDSTLSHLTQRIHHGAFRGLKTTQGKADFIAQLTEDLSQVSNEKKTIAFFDFFAGGPLFSSLQMSTPIIWSASLNQFPQDRDLLARFYAAAETRPDILVWFDSVPVASYFNYDLRHEQRDSLKELLLPSYEKKIVRKDYAVYVKKSE